MKKYIVGFVLLICLISFIAVPAMAAQDDKILTPKQKAADKLKEHTDTKVVEQKASHKKSDYTNVVPGVGNLKYEKAQVPNGFEAPYEVVTMVSWNDKGKLHIRDIEHKTATIQIPWETLQDIEGFDGKHVRVWHYNDNGICDGKWVQTVRNEGGFAYLESVPFSEVVVGGFTGTYSKVESEIDITDTISLGRTFDSDDVSSVTLTIDDQYSTKTDPYDIDTTGLVAWYKGDEGTGTTATDSSIFANNGTFLNENYANGKYNSGFVFNGINSTIEIQHIDALNFNEFTFISYIQKDSNPVVDERIIKKTNSYDFTINTDGTARLNVNNLDDTFSSGSYPSVCDGKLHLIAGVYDGSYLDIFVDGIRVIHDDATGSMVSNTNWVYIGSSSGSDNFFTGKLDNIIIYNRSLSESEIKELYYISSSEIQAKTNSHAEYSTEWNSSADNPLSVPFGESESISSLTFNQPASIVQNGVTIYNPINVLMNVTATIGYTEDTYMIEEFCDQGFYIDQYAVEITHTPSADNANGLISYNPTDSLCCDIMSKAWTYELETNNPNASITTFDCNSLVIDTGAISSGTVYTYTVTAETDHLFADGTTANQKAASLWGDGVAVMSLVFTISIIATGIMALKYANDPEKSAMPAIKSIIGLTVGLLVFTIIVTFGTAIGAAIETLLGV